jgi:excisionase family DNA binding protein
MTNAQILFPMDPHDYWQELRRLIYEVLQEQQQQQVRPAADSLEDKLLLKVGDVCSIFKVSKPTVYDWIKRGRLVSVKIESRRYFHRHDVEALIHSSRVSGVDLAYGYTNRHNES